MGWFFDDIYSALERQFNKDKERKAKELASATADPAIAARISAYRKRHPHLKPGVVLSAAQAGLAPDDPAIDRLAQAEAKRKVNKNKGWFSIGDKPVGMNPLEYIGRSWDDVEKAAKTGIRGVLTIAQSGGELLQAEARETAKEFTDFSSGGPLKAATRLHSGELFGKESLKQTTAAVALERLVNNSEGGAGIGDGYLPRGAAVDEQKRRARESYFIEYADHPVWHQPGDKRVSEPHAGTLGRIALKDVVQPGSRPYWLLSGIIDAGFQIAADPLAAAGKGAKGLSLARKAFTPEEAGRRAVGAVDGIRPTIHPPTTQNWLTLSKPGQKFTDWAASTNDPYQVWRKLGGEKGNITPDLAVRIADTRTTDDVLTTLGDELGIGLRTKPITSSVQPVGGYLGEVKSSIYENRLFNKMPHKAVRVDDPEEVANQLVRLGRGGELDEASIGQLFNQAARATTPEERVNVLRETEVRIAKSMAEKLHGPISGRDINYSRLRGVFERNEAAMQQVIKSQIANKTGVKATTIDGLDVPLSSVHLEGEYLDEIYQLPDPREMRRMLNQYGRLLNNPVLDIPISALDHIQNVWRGAAILRPALTLRTIGEEQAWMAGAGYSSLFSHPFSLIAWATGRKGTPDGIFDAADELSAFSKSQAKSDQWRTRIIGSQQRIVPFTDPEFTKAWSNDIWKLRDDDVARRLAGGWQENDLVEIPVGAPSAPNLPPLYHGTPRAITKPMQGGGLSSENLFGPGFYSTDNPKVAKEYFRKGKRPEDTPLMYSVKHGGEPKILDMEAPLPDELRAPIQERVIGNLSNIEVPLDEYQNLLELLETGSGADIYKAFKKNLSYADPPIPRGEVDDILTDLNDLFLERGIDAFKYKGGVRTGRQEHNAYVFLRPEDISIMEAAAKSARSGDPLADAKAWLRSDAAKNYRRLNNVTDDLVDGYVENLSNTLKGKTYGDKSLLDAISTGIYNNRPIFAKSDQGAITLDQGFRNHLKKLVDSDVSPDHTIGDLPSKRPHAREFYSKATDIMFDTLLTRPHNYLSASPVFKQAFWKRVEEGIIHAAPETQARMLALAEEANMGSTYIKTLRQRAKVASGNLEEEEYLLWAKAQALEEKKRVITDLSDKNQLLDAMRLTIVFSEAWKQSLTTWARIISQNPAVLPRATMTVQGGRGSGFFYTDEQTGEEMMAYPGAGFLTGKLNQALGGANVPFPIQARVESLTMFGANPLLPSFGPIAQVAAGKLLPDTPDNESLRKMIIPYDSDPVRLPGWLDKVWTAAFTDPNKNVAYGNLVWDVSRYLHSTGEYDISTYPGQQALEDKARKTARFLLLFRGLAQSSLPAAPSYQDLAKDVDGHTTLAFTLTKRYQELLDEDRDKRTNEATSRFITEFGMDNLLYMQSASKGGEVFTKSGLDWVKRNPDIVSRYPEVYGLLAPTEGGLDLKAYMALFENGTRRPIPPKEALSLANHRAAKMVLRSAQAQLPDPAKRTPAQRLWLDGLKETLKDKFPGFDPEYQGTDIPKKIEQLSQAVDDPMLSRLPQTQAIRTYLAARETVNQLANKSNILGWQTAKKLKPQRQWLREVASKLITETPQFRQVYDELFDNEMTADD